MVLLPLSIACAAAAAVAGSVPASILAFLTPNKKSDAFNKSYLLAGLETLVVALNVNAALPLPLLVVIKTTPLEALAP